jgi:pSer/pThr/pTyr-binding forkhead associated (FHA) protein
MTNPLRTTKRFSSPGGLTPLDTPACLVQIYGGALGRRVELLGSPITIGRDDDNEISVDQSTVSRRHSRVFSDGRQHWVEDLKSTNGTFVNERRVGQQLLTEGDVIQVGETYLQFRTEHRREA